VGLLPQTRRSLLPMDGSELGFLIVDFFGFHIVGLLAQTKRPLHSYASSNLLFLNFSLYRISTILLLNYCL
jgi:hypothetical protein